MIGLIGGVTKENKKRECEILPSKRERRKWKKYVESQAFLLDVHVAKLMYQELLFERRMRRKAIRLSRKHKTRDYIS